MQALLSHTVQERFVLPDRHHTRELTFAICGAFHRQGSPLTKKSLTLRHVRRRSAQRLRILPNNYTDMTEKIQALTAEVALLQASDEKELEALRIKYLSRRDSSTN